MKAFIIVGAINAFIAVALGAFGAHGLKDKLDAYYLDIWKTGCHLSNVSRDRDIDYWSTHW